MTETRMFKLATSVVRGRDGECGSQVAAGGCKYGSPFPACAADRATYLACPYHAKDKDIPVYGDG